MSSHSLLIAGGGIGGLSAALGLAGKGFEVIVFERASKFGEIGAGIQLGPNAFYALDYFGVGEWAREKAVYVDMLRLMDAMSGEEIIHIPLDAPFRERFGNPYAVVHRGDLHGVLLKGCKDSPRIALRVNSEVVSYEQDGSGVRATLASDETIDGLALIGADGLRSNLRTRVVGDGVPRVSGHSTYRAVIPLEAMPKDLRWNAATLWAGPKCHIVHYPLSDWKYFNLVVTTHDDAPEPVTGKPGMTGGSGFCATATRWTTGLMETSRCWAILSIRRCSTRPRAHVWRWKMRCASRICSTAIVVTSMAHCMPIRRRGWCARRGCNSDRAPSAI